jgi:uncharacterized protein YjbI with pentapeptide repeats
MRASLTTIGLLVFSAAGSVNHPAFAIDAAGVKYAYVARDVIVVEGTYVAAPTYSPGAANEIPVILERIISDGTDESGQLARIRAAQESAGHLVLDRIIKGGRDAAGPIVVEGGPNSPPAILPDGTKVRIYFKASPAWALVCARDGTLDPARVKQCTENDDAVERWQENVRAIDDAIDSGQIPTLLAKARDLEEIDPANSEKALRGAVAKGAMREAGPLLGSLLVRQHRYTEAAALLGSLIVEGGEQVDFATANLRQVARAAAGLSFDASSIDFSGIQLKDVYLFYVSLTDRHFDLRGDNIRLRNVDLTRLKGGHVALSQATLEDVKLRESEIGGRDGRGGLDLFTADIRDSDFSHARLRFASVTGSSIRRSQFDESDLTDAGFDHTRISDTSFSGATLTQSRFTGADLVRATFDGANLVGAQFEEARLRHVDFSEARRGHVPTEPASAMRNANLEPLLFDPILGAAWKNATYDCGTRWPTGFRPARYGLFPSQRGCVDHSAVDYRGLRLTDIKLADLDLSEASFRGAELAGECQGTSLRRVDFTQAHVVFEQARGCDFSGALFRRANVLVPLAESQLDGARFIDSTIHAYSLLSFWNHYFARGNDTVSDLPGAIFIRTRIVCTDQTYWTVGPKFNPWHPEEMAAALAKLRSRGARIDASCRRHFPALARRS